MRKAILCLLILGTVSCKEPEKKIFLKSKDTLTKVVSQVKSHPKDTIPVYDTSIYKKIDPSVFVILKKYLPEWNLPAPSVWDRFWFNEYYKNGSLVDYITADFNGDNMDDYALILENNGTFVVWVLQSSKDKFKPIKLFEIGDGNSPLEIGIELTAKGELNYIDPDVDNPKPIYLKNPAITIEKFETTANTYYWRNGKYNSVCTGD